MKIANSGLSFDHLELAYCRKGDQGLSELLMEEFEGRPRVTKRLQVINKVCKYFH